MRSCIIPHVIFHHGSLNSPSVLLYAFTFGYTVSNSEFSTYTGSLSLFPHAQVRVTRCCQLHHVARALAFSSRVRRKTSMLCGHDSPQAEHEDAVLLLVINYLVVDDGRTFFCGDINECLCIGGSSSGKLSALICPEPLSRDQPQRPGLSERIFDVSSGREHALLLISKGRVFSAASSSDSFPSRGQLGIPGHLKAFFQSSSHTGKIWNMQLAAY